MGENWASRELNPLMRSRLWKHTVVFITWDDFGGFYDNVPPSRRNLISLGPVFLRLSSLHTPDPVTSIIAPTVLVPSCVTSKISFA